MCPKVWLWLPLPIQQKNNQVYSLGESNMIKEKIINNT